MQLSAPPNELHPAEKAYGKPALRVAVAPVVSTSETIRSYSGLLDYLGKDLQRPVRLILGNTYTEINELVRARDCDVAFVCSYAYLVGKRDFGMQALVIPEIHGDVYYYSDIIVPTDSSVRDWKDLRNGVFAYSDPLSNTGYLAPCFLLMSHGEEPRSFFRETTFTYSHDNSVRAVADKVVDGAAVDSLVLDYLAAVQPGLVQRIRVINRSQAFGVPPVVVHPKIDTELRRKLQDAFLRMNEDPQGRAVLKQQRIDRFRLPDEHLYDSTREMMAKVQAGS